MSSVHHTPTYNSYYNTYSNPHTIQSNSGSNPFTYTYYNSNESQSYLNSLYTYPKVTKEVYVHKDDMGYILGTKKRNFINIKNLIYPYATIIFEQVIYKTNTYKFIITGREYEVNMGIQNLLRIKESLYEKQRYYYNFYKYQYENYNFTNDTDWVEPSSPWLNEDTPESSVTTDISDNCYINYEYGIEPKEDTSLFTESHIENSYNDFTYGIDNYDPYELSLTMV